MPLAGLHPTPPLQDENTRYIDIGPVNKVLNMLACWLEDPEGPAFKKHLPRWVGGRAAAGGWVAAGGRVGGWVGGCWWAGEWVGGWVGG